MSFAAVVVVAKNMYNVISFIKRVACVVQDRLLKPLGGFSGYSSEWRELAQVISRVSSLSVGRSLRSVSSPPDVEQF